MKAKEWVTSDEMAASHDSVPQHKKHAAANLLKCLRDGRAAALAFMTDFGVPVDNNLMGRNVRMMKVQQKPLRRLSAVDQCPSLLPGAWLYRHRPQKRPSGLVGLNPSVGLPPATSPRALPFIPDVSHPG